MLLARVMAVEWAEMCTTLVDGYQVFHAAPAKSRHFRDLWGNFARDFLIFLKF
jgi:hypothetical protein